MRLIDVDEAIKQLDPNTWQGEMLIAILNGLPTAYDVDGTIKLMESLKANNKDAGREIDKFIRNQHFDICISIVKGAVKE